MFRFLALIILCYLLYRLVKGFIKEGKEYQENAEDGDVIDNMIQCPCCKTYIPMGEAVKKKFKGKEILFCSRGCADNFGMEKNS